MPAAPETNSMVSGNCDEDGDERHDRRDDRRRKLRTGRCRWLVVRSRLRRLMPRIGLLQHTSGALEFKLWHVILILSSKAFVDFDLSFGRSDSFEDRFHPLTRRAHKLSKQLSQLRVRPREGDELLLL